TRSYPVGDLVAAPEDGAKLVTIANQVLVMGTGARLVFLDPLKALVLTGNRSAHARLARLCEQLRGGSEDAETVKAIKAKLNDPVTLEFVETPISDVIDFLRDYTRVNIVINRQPLSEEGVSVDTPMSIHVQSMELRSALTLMLNQANLTFAIEDECLEITSKAAASDRFNLRCYPVGTLLAGQSALGGEDWLRLVYSVVAGGLAESGHMFMPGSGVLVRSEAGEFVASVVELTESAYRVQFRVGEQEHDEWVDASRIRPMPRTQPVV